MRQVYFQVLLLQIWSGGDLIFLTAMEDSSKNKRILGLVNLVRLSGNLSTRYRWIGLPLGCRLFHHLFSKYIATKERDYLENLRVYLGLDISLRIRACSSPADWNNRFGLRYCRTRKTLPYYTHNFYES